MIKKLIPFFVIVIFSILTILPLLKSGYFPIHDGVHPQRIDQMEKALFSGQIPPRWSPDLGYGYGWPQFNFYSPLPYYAGAIINFFTNDALVSTKILFLMALFLSGFFMYLVSRELFGKLAGIVSAIFYIYSPYHSLDIYVRGALAELWGIMFIPLVLFFLVKMFKEKKIRWVIGGGISYALLILSHNITALVFSLFLILGIIFFIISSIFLKKKNNLQFFLEYVVLTIFLGLILSCYFWLPAILESKYTYLSSITGGKFGYQTHFIAFRQIWDSPWDYGGSAGLFSGLSYMVGKLHLIVAVLAVILAFIKKRLRVFTSIIIIFLGLAVLMTNAKSDFIWSSVSSLNFVQFPWRFLIFVMFFVSFLAGLFIYHIKNNKLKLFLSLILIFLVIILNKNYFHPNKYLNVAKNDFLIGKNLYEWGTAASEEYLPIWRPKKIVPPPSKLIEVLNGSYNLESKKVGLIKFKVNLNFESIIKVNSSYFPGWKVYVDSKEVKINYLKDGLINFNCPKGTHEIIIQFEETRLRFLADAISAGSIFILLSIFMLKLLDE